MIERLLRHLDRSFVGAQQTRPIMVPGEMFHYSLARRRTHALDDFRMTIQMLDRTRDCIDISRLNNDSFDTVTHHVAGFAGGDHRQTASGSFVNRFGAALQARRENVNRSLIEIILEVALKTENANILETEPF